MQWFKIVAAASLAFFPSSSLAQNNVAYVKYPFPPSLFIWKVARSCLPSKAFEIPYGIGTRGNCLVRRDTANLSNDIGAIYRYSRRPAVCSCTFWRVPNRGLYVSTGLWAWKEKLFPNKEEKEKKTNSLTGRCSLLRPTAHVPSTRKPSPV